VKDKLILYYASIFIIVFSNVLYHISQKSTPKGINPFFTLLITYITATLITALALILYHPDKSETISLRDLKWTSFALGFAVVGLEVGYLLAYRSGWNISIGSLVSNTTVALLLIPVGVLMYGESIAPIKLIGIIFCMIGLLLIYLR